MGIKDAYRIPDGNAISNFHRFPHTHRKDAVGGLPMTEGKLPNGHPFGGSNSDRSVTIVSKVSLAWALGLLRAPMPVFSLFLDLQRYDFYHIRANFSPLVFVCKSTTTMRNLFAPGFIHFIHR